VQPGYVIAAREFPLSANEPGIVAAMDFADCAVAVGGSRLHQHALRPKRPDYRLPFVEDAASAQLALNLILRALQDKVWDLKTCALMLYDLQIACSNLKRLGEDMPVLPDQQEPSLVSLLMQKLDEMAAETAAETAQEAPEENLQPWEKKPAS